jgi:phosphate transport system protein
MSRLLDSGLEQLTTMVYKMGEVAEKTIDISIRGFIEGKDVSNEVQELSEFLVPRTAEIEDKAFELIVKYQPVASDLRIINSYMKIAYDFERYGRYAWDISFTHKKLGLDSCAVSWGLMGQLVERVSEMVANSVRALRDHDVKLAKALAETEKEVDEIFFRYVDELAASTAGTKLAMCNLLVARYLERIADHTTYVGEAIVYIDTGEKVTLR